jgi:hypothetical protein
MIDRHIKAIETRYRGYRFRSRLEARWAVFLHHTRTAFEYEFEGFALPSGWYLPDFYLPEWKAFVEVKPPPAPDLLLSTGVRVRACDLLIVRAPTPDLLPVEIVHGLDLIRAGACDRFLAVYGDPRAILEAPASWFIDISLDEPRISSGIGVLDLIPARLIQAADAARAARFDATKRL